MAFLTFLAGPPGSWLYTFVLLAVLEAAAALALQQWMSLRQQPDGGDRATWPGRLALGAGGLFLLRAAVLLVTLLIPEGSGAALAILPPLDRAAAAITVIGLIWLLAYPTSSFKADVGALMLSLTALSGLALEWVWWTQAVVVGIPYFNGSLYDTLWVAASVLLLAGGAWQLSRRRPAGWRAGLALLGLLLLGYAIDYLYPVARFNTSGVVRWTELAVVPLAMLLLYRRASTWQPESSAAAPAASAPRTQPVWLGLVETLLVAGLVFFTLEFATARFQVEGPSMQPGLHTGQYVLADQLAYRLGSPQRGDLVTVRPNVPSSPQYIKRLMGLPGDSLAVKNGALWINGAKITEPYLAEPPRYVGAWQLGPDEYFVLGDNRNDSDDSHIWGSVRRPAITGKVVLVYWPLTQAGLAPNFSFVNS